METILVVDDERRLVDLWRRVLERRGYGVLIAMDGEEALTVHYNYRQVISAVVLDYGLPRLDGRQVYLKLKELNPSIRVLIVSGYLDSDALAGIQSFAGTEFLQKPFLPSDLVNKRETLLQRPLTQS
jgi:DNA-binding response OmpR family regulator